MSGKFGLEAVVRPTRILNQRLMAREGGPVGLVSEGPFLKIAVVGGGKWGEQEAVLEKVPGRVGMEIQRELGLETLEVWRDRRTEIHFPPAMGFYFDGKKLTMNDGGGDRELSAVGLNSFGGTNFVIGTGKKTGALELEYGFLEEGKIKNPRLVSLEKGTIDLETEVERFVQMGPFTAREPVERAGAVYHAGEGECFFGMEDGRVGKTTFVSMRLVEDSPVFHYGVYDMGRVIEPGQFFCEEAQQERWLRVDPQGEDDWNWTRGLACKKEGEIAGRLAIGGVGGMVFMEGSFEMKGPAESPGIALQKAVQAFRAEEFGLAGYLATVKCRLGQEKVEIEVQEEVRTKREDGVWERTLVGNSNLGGFWSEKQQYFQREKGEWRDKSEKVWALPEGRIFVKGLDEVRVGSGEDNFRVLARPGERGLEVDFSSLVGVEVTEMKAGSERISLKRMSNGSFLSEVEVKKVSFLK